MRTMRLFAVAAVVVVAMCGCDGAMVARPPKTAAKKMKQGRAPFAPPRHHPHVPLDRLRDPSHPTAAQNCTTKWATQKLDHYSQMQSNQQTYQQRYLVCDPTGVEWKPNGTIFFYTGNEANVELYVTSTGLMWENAAEFNARLVFAEHRFFGESLPFPGNPMPDSSDLETLTVDQALADYAALVQSLKQEWNSAGSPVIAFGGSYGGMLASWFRIKYPDSCDGSIAGSAPIVNFVDVNPAYPPTAFNDVVTFDATAAAGAAEGCADNVRQGFADIQQLAATGEGLITLNEIFHVCETASLTGPWNLMNYIAGSMGNMAMSSYPYPSAYLLLGGQGTLPAYPMRVGCKNLGGTLNQTERLAGLYQFANVYYNASGTMTCTNPEGQVNEQSEIIGYLWNRLSCANMLMPYGTNGVTDMFWSSPWSIEQMEAYCAENFNLVTQPDWPKNNFGGWGVSRWGSNIVFSNGGFDPWRPGGITSAVSPNVTSMIIPEVGHHIDLMFSNPADTPAVKAARQTELKNIRAWIAGKQPIP